MRAKVMTLIAALMMAGASEMMAQPGAGKGNCTSESQGLRQGDCNIPGITDEQKNKILQLRLSHQKEMLALRNKLNELQAHEQTLATMDNPDMNAINTNIDEMTRVQNKIMKARAAHRNQVRNLLNDEQKVWFDSNRGKERGPKKGKGEGEYRGMHGYKHNLQP